MISGLQQVWIPVIQMDNDFEHVADLVFSFDLAGVYVVSNLTYSGLHISLSE
jgi:hypothetical protein